MYLPCRGFDLGSRGDKEVISAHVAGAVLRGLLLLGKMSPFCCWKMVIFLATCYTSAAKKKNVGQGAHTVQGTVVASYTPASYLHVHILTFLGMVMDHSARNTKSADVGKWLQIFLLMNITIQHNLVMDFFFPCSCFMLCSCFCVLRCKRY